MSKNILKTVGILAVVLDLLYLGILSQIDKITGHIMLISYGEADVDGMFSNTTPFAMVMFFVVLIIGAVLFYFGCQDNNKN